MAGTQSEERGDLEDLDVFDEGGEKGGPDDKSEEMPDDGKDGSEKPPLESTDRQDVTYGSTDAEPELSSTELPELTFNAPDGASDVVLEEDGSDAVVFEDDDAAVVLEDASLGGGEAEVGPAPDYPDDDSDQSGEASNFDTYEIAENPLFANHDFTIEYADEDEDDGE